jgi:hypothetical protein
LQRISLGSKQKPKKTESKIEKSKEKWDGAGEI